MGYELGGLGPSYLDAKILHSFEFLLIGYGSIDFTAYMSAKFILLTQALIGVFELGCAFLTPLLSLLSYN